ncbi:MAG: metallophosphatase family protein [Candidatus Marsarchaeota archaeon]|nr:metallophosphatase family protein [Candidatus Marsarchaeota archaeon]
MKVCVISDIHSNIYALKAVLSSVSFDGLLVCGDIVGYYLWPNEVIDVLREMSAISVRGNHDEAVLNGDSSWFNEVARAGLEYTVNSISLESKAYLAGLPTSVQTDLYGAKIAMYHGSPRDNLYEYVYPDMVESLQWPDADFVMIGHTHLPFKRTLGGRLIVNPGSVGQPRDGDPRASACIVDLATRTADHLRVKYDVDSVARAVVDAGLPRFLGERLYHGR